MIVTEAYANVSAVCPKLIRAGWDELTTKGATPAGRAQLKEDLRLCNAPPNQGAAEGLAGWYNVCSCGTPRPGPVRASFHRPFSPSLLLALSFSLSLSRAQCVFVLCGLAAF